MSIAHLQDSQSVSRSDAIQDGIEAQEGGISARFQKSTSFAKAHATKPPKPKKTESNAETEDKLKESSRQTRSETATSQVDAKELAAAVELKGARDRDHESLENNERYFSTLTTSNKDYLFQQIDSIVESILDKAHPRSLIDKSFEDEPLEKRAFLKVVMLEIAMAEPEVYGIDLHKLEILEAERNALYETHKEYIEQTKLAIDVGQATVGALKFSIKHAIQMFHLIPESNENVDLSLSNFLRKIMANTGKDVYMILKKLYKKWSILARRDRKQYKQDVLQYRQYIMQRKLSQIKMTIALLNGLDQIAELCKSHNDMREESN